MKLWSKGRCLVAASAIAAIGMGAVGARAQDKDRTFVQKASEGDLAEIKFAVLALNTSNVEGIKKFAHQMINDHVAMEAAMKPIAQKLGVAPATSLSPEDQKKYDEMSKLVGKDFNVIYVKTMIVDHRKDLKEFHDELSTTSDSELKEAVEKGSEMIREHLNEIQEVASANAVMYPAPTPEAPAPAPENAK